MDSKAAVQVIDITTLTRALICLALLCLLSIGCRSESPRGTCNGVDLVDQGPDQIEMYFCKRYWVGFGIHGYVGFADNPYAAALLGSGPIFTNPLFSDEPFHFRCVGTISLDLARGRVTVNMKRIVSGPGEPERTKAHPANGIYTIKSFEKARPDEQGDFKEWLKQNHY